MATTNPTVYRLTIALVVFVLLTFILTITTYLFFKQRSDEQAKALVAEKATSDKQAALNAAEQENRRLRELIGAAEGATLETVETDLNNLFTKDFAGFNEEPKSYGRLVAWLRAEFQRRAADAKAAETKLADSAKAVTAASKDVEAARQDADKRVGEARDEQATQKKEYDDARATLEKEKNDLLAQKQKAEAESTQLAGLIKAIGMLQDDVPSKKDKFAAAPPEQRLEILRSEIIDLRKTIRQHNDELKVLRASKPEDRVIAFDGHIATVDAGERSVTIVCPTTRTARPGMELRVFRPDIPNPKNADSKATLVVTRIEGDSRLRAAIRGDAPENPIIPGDAVASSLWNPGPMEIAVVGRLNVGRGAGPADRAWLTRRIEAAGGSISAAVTSTTAFVLDGGDAPTPAETPDDEPTRQLRSQRESALRDAKKYGIPVGGIDTLADLLGLTPADLVATPRR